MSGANDDFPYADESAITELNTHLGKYPDPKLMVCYPESFDNGELEEVHKQVCLSVNRFGMSFVGNREYYRNHTLKKIVPVIESQCDFNAFVVVIDDIGYIGFSKLVPHTLAGYLNNLLRNNSKEAFPTLPANDAWHPGMIALLVECVISIITCHELGHILYGHSKKKTWVEYADKTTGMDDWLRKQCNEIEADIFASTWIDCAGDTEALGLIRVDGPPVSSIDDMNVETE